MNRYYLVGNAHLDPVWQWRWQEGSAEAKATVRSALDRMKEFPDFRFVCSSASVYRWLQEFSTEMFEEIRERVKEGRFIIVGGWHVQPDCNLPSGEGFARQSLYAQRYFHDTLGTTAKVGYNVDSFGHCATLPLILKESGMENYIFMRPGPHEKELESNLFEWVAPDGSRVLTYRILDPYCFRFEDEEQLQGRFDYLEGENQNSIDALPLFYGVGNHGGGPTIRHLEVLRDYAAAHPDKQLIYSDLSDFFDYARNSGVAIPKLHDDLQHHAPGCYATVSAIKAGIRRSESSLVAAEGYSVLAGTLCGKSYPSERFADAWREVCFCHFHDSMDGCSVAPVYEDAAQMLGFARHTAAVAENNALQTISWATDTSDRSRGLPVFVFNPHAYPVEQVVTANVHYAGVTDSEGNPIPTQNTVSPALPCSGRSDTTFRASVPAMGYAVYYLTEQNGATEQPVTVSATPRVAPLCAGRGDGPVLENEFWRIQFEDYTGYISSMIDKQSGENILSGRAAVPTVIDEFYHDTWSHAKSYFTDVMARFSDATVTVTENGPVRATVKVVSRYNGSTVTLRFSLCAGDPTLHMSGEVDWHEKHKMLKLAFPLRVDNPVADYEIPFGVMRRPADGEEEPGLGFVAVRNEQSGAGYAFLNDSSYSTSIAGGTVYLTVLRSPIFADHGGERNADSAYTEQGVRPFRYAMMPVDGSNAAPVKAARLLNAPMSVVVENWHEGTIKETRITGLSVSADNVVVSALKRAEDGSGVVVRLYETDGKQTEVTVSGCVLSQPIRTTLRGFGMKTLLLGDDGSCREVLLTEFDK